MSISEITSSNSMVSTITKPTSSNQPTIAVNNTIASSDKDSVTISQKGLQKSAQVSVEFQAQKIADKAISSMITEPFIGYPLYKIGHILPENESLMSALSDEKQQLERIKSGSASHGDYGFRNLNDVFIRAKEVNDQLQALSMFGQDNVIAGENELIEKAQVMNLSHQKIAEHAKNHNINLVSNDFFGERLGTTTSTNKSNQSFEGRHYLV